MTVRVCGAVSTVCGRTSTRASCNTKKSSVAEQWRPVVGYEGLYVVSDQCHVKSLERTVRRGLFTLRVRERILAAARREGTDFWQVALSREGATRRFYVHLLAREAFSDD